MVEFRIAAAKPGRAKIGVSFIFHRWALQYSEADALCVENRLSRPPYPPIDPTAQIEPIRQSVALTTGQGTILGALALDLVVAREIETAAVQGDLTARTRIESRVRHRLADRTGAPPVIDWAVDQIARA